MASCRFSARMSFSFGYVIRPKILRKTFRSKTRSLLNSCFLTPHLISLQQHILRISVLYSQILNCLDSLRYLRSLIQSVVIATSHLDSYIDLHPTRCILREYRFQVLKLTDILIKTVSHLQRLWSSISTFMVNRY